jgi:hypothetical protein
MSIQLSVISENTVRNDRILSIGPVLGSARRRPLAQRPGPRAVAPAMSRPMTIPLPPE